MDHPESAKQPLRRSSCAGLPTLLASVIPCPAPEDYANNMLRIQLATNALHAGGSVVWVGKELFGPSTHTHVIFHLLIVDMADASCQLVGPRLKELIEHPWTSGKQPESSQFGFQARLNNLHHFTTPALPHLLALLTHQSTSFPPFNTSLIVIDSVSTLFALAFPKILENADILQTPAKKSEAVQWSAGRRWAVMGEFMSKIGRLAATSNIAILLTSQTTTRIKYETRAVLNPAVSGNAWDSGIGARLVLFRDWLFRGPETPNSRGEYVPGVRFAGVMKAKGVTYEGVGKVITFTIEEVGCPQYNSCSRAKQCSMVFMKCFTTRLRSG